MPPTCQLEASCGQVGHHLEALNGVFKMFRKRIPKWTSKGLLKGTKEHQSSTQNGTEKALKKEVLLDLEAQVCNFAVSSNNLRRSGLSETVPYWVNVWGPLWIPSGSRVVTNDNLEITPKKISCLDPCWCLF